MKYNLQATNIYPTIGDTKNVVVQFTYYEDDGIVEVFYRMLPAETWLDPAASAAALGPMLDQVKMKRGIPVETVQVDPVTVDAVKASVAIKYGDQETAVVPVEEAFPVPVVLVDPGAGEVGAVGAEELKP